VIELAFELQDRASPATPERRHEPPEEVLVQLAQMAAAVERAQPYADGPVRNDFGQRPALRSPPQDALSLSRPDADDLDAYSRRADTERLQGRAYSPR
jgi:hypothetical protein